MGEYDVRVAPSTLHYHVIYHNGKWTGVLDKIARFYVGGNETAYLNTDDFECLLRGGILSVHPGSKWDFATGAFDTEDMRIASLLHDAFCNMRKAFLISFKERMRANTLFRQVLDEKGCSWLRRWYSYLAVTAYTFVTRG